MIVAPAQGSNGSCPALIEVTSNVSRPGPPKLHIDGLAIGSSIVRSSARPA
jgi:hypothetical protein